ncbi:MAG: CBS domain-containing protein [Burkholderiales bacterium]|nr:CBS domain-containing protein [Burkholderiales bacterium]
MQEMGPLTSPASGSPPWQDAYASQPLAEQSLATPLGELPLPAPVACSPNTPVGEALERMQRLRIGSIVVVDEGGVAVGILTRYDVLGRVVLAQVPLATPMSEVMMRPVRTLSADHTAQDAALLMASQGIGHVPVTRGEVVVGMVSARDLFALHRLSLGRLGDSLREAQDLQALRHLAGDVREFARKLLSLGVQARQLTGLISHLNDILTRRLLQLKAAEHAVPLARWCWLALGSEGRFEQTIATDQDNALILPDDAGEAERAAALAFAHDVNLGLDACGYRLCKGGVMAGEPECCLTLARWQQRFVHWIDHGAPKDLLNASIFFDLRPLAGDNTLGEQLAASVTAAAQATPRFQKQLALNALDHGAPLGWLGSIRPDADGTIDLKLQGTTLFVEAARLNALAQGIASTHTRERLQRSGARMGVPAAECESWVTAFEFLQMLRLRLQLRLPPPTGEPNRLRVDTLNDFDRRMLREALRIGRMLQQRMQLDYDR